jgi:uncharacterized protein (DUF885 family)
MTAFSAFVDAFHSHRSENPNHRVSLGLSERLGELPDPSLAACDRRIERARHLRRAVDHLAQTPLEFDEQIDLDLARLMLDAEVFDASYEFNGQRTLPQQPRAGDEIGDGIFMLSVADPRPAAERLVDITRRIEAVPDYLATLTTRLSTPVERWVQMDLAKVRGLPTLLGNIERWAETERFADAPVARAVEAANTALEHYARTLEATPTRAEFHIGESAARELVRLRGIEQPLEELHAMARRFLAETQAQIEELRARLVRKHGLDAGTSRSALHQHLNERFRLKLASGNFEQILVRYRREHENLMKFIRERDLFPLPRDHSLLILATPDFMRPSIPAGAMNPPAPFRAGTATSVIFLTLAEELLDEHTELGIPIMMVHEGVPGHHLQFASAYQNPSRIRRHVMANDHAEGWTTLQEDYMLDQGYLTDLADEARFCAKRDLCRIGARVAIDLFFMTGQRDYLDVGLGIERGQSDPFEAAGHLLQTVTGFTPGRVQAELNWYSMERGYPLSYLTGNQLAKRLRADVAAAGSGRRTPAQSDRLFFAKYLSAGNMPLSFLRRVFTHDGLIES